MKAQTNLKRSVSRKRKEPKRLVININKTLLGCVIIFFSLFLLIGTLQTPKDIRHRAQQVDVPEDTPPQCFARRGACKQPGMCNPINETDAGALDCTGGSTCCAVAVPPPMCRSMGGICDTQCLDGEREGGQLDCPQSAMCCIVEASPQCAAQLGQCADECLDDETDAGALDCRDNGKCCVPTALMMPANPPAQPPAGQQPPPGGQVPPPPAGVQPTFFNVNTLVSPTAPPPIIPNNNVVQPPVNNNMPAPINTVAPQQPVIPSPGTLGGLPPAVPGVSQQPGGPNQQNMEEEMEEENGGGGGNKEKNKDGDNSDNDNGKGNSKNLDNLDRDNVIELIIQILRKIIEILSGRN